MYTEFVIEKIVTPNNDRYEHRIFFLKSPFRNYVLY